GVQRILVRDIGNGSDSEALESRFRPARSLEGTRPSWPYGGAGGFGLFACHASSNRPRMEACRGFCDLRDDLSDGQSENKCDHTKRHRDRAELGNGNIQNGSRKTSVADWNS